MKTVHSLLFTLLIVLGFSSSAALAGEPNTAALGNEQSKIKSVDESSNLKTMAGRECPPEMTHEKNAEPTGTWHRGPQHTGVLKE